MLPSLKSFLVAAIVVCVVPFMVSFLVVPLSMKLFVVRGRTLFMVVMHH